jgi:hypothetical protein
MQTGTSDITQSEECRKSGQLMTIQPAEMDTLAKLEAKTERLITSLNLSDFATLEPLTRMMARADRLLSECHHDVFVVRDYLIHAAEITDPETGEVRGLARLVWLLSDNKTVSTTAPAVIQRWYAICRHFFANSTYRPLAVTVAAHQGRTAGKWLELSTATLAHVPGEQAKDKGAKHDKGRAGQA